MSIDASELDALARDASAAAKVARDQANKVLRAVSFALERRIKEEMPVDTGRARASWGHGSDESIYEEGDLTTLQGSSVIYIEPLNAGHSQQAPAGFIDTAQLQAEVELMSQLGLIDPLDPNLGFILNL